MEMRGTVGTLGKSLDDVTCSILATKSLEGHFNVEAFSEFEFAADALIEGVIDAMVVPGAYPCISQFIMNKQLRVVGVFTYVIPAIVFASKDILNNCVYDVLYNHIATNPLIKDVGNAKWCEQKNVSSNTIACLEVLENEHTCCAITNAACANKYGLFIHQVIRKSINMPFVVFEKSKMEDEER